MLVVSILESDRRRGHILPIVLQLGAFAWTKYTFFVHDFIFVVLEMSRFILTVLIGGGQGGAWLPNFGTTQKSVVSANAQIKVLESWCLGTSALSAAHLNGLHTCSSRSNAQFKFGALKGAVSALKALQGSETETRGVARGCWEELQKIVFSVLFQCFPDQQSLICPPGKSMIFHKNETERN